MLYYGDLSGWPGGNGGDRRNYYPRKVLNVGQFWETDITALADKNQVRRSAREAEQCTGPIA
jgi:hypothetical protein